MKTSQLIWTAANGWSVPTNPIVAPQLILVFGNRYELEKPETFGQLRTYFPTGSIVIVSTSGEILDSNVYDNSIVATAIEFEKTTVECTSLQLSDSSNSFDAGIHLMGQLPHNGLKHVLVFSEGRHINGSELIKGINSALPENVNVTGGLAGDADNFVITLVGLNQTPTTNTMVAVGLYSDVLQVGYGSVGGWDSYGPVRKITKSEGNKLYSLDDQPALELYKRYLGDLVADLPGSALLFPLSIKAEDNQPAVVRTILGIDEENQAMIFAGDIQQDADAQLMKANFDRIIEAAEDAAESSTQSITATNTELALCISCVGRKMILGPRTVEEVEQVREVLGDKPAIIGFYSYGELAPFRTTTKCELHNQTMTITLFSEQV
ncbi:MAG: FIST C-terminal domain-containing protein [Candidatus Kapaibacterium sp.]|nr:FIST C-terminal domain-containing protein [Bacteroidota bacterium]